MNADMLKTIDDRSLESVSGGHGIIARAIEAGSNLYQHIAGGALERVGDAISAVGKRISSLGDK